MQGYFMTPPPWPPFVLNQTCGACGHPNKDHFFWREIAGHAPDITGCRECTDSICGKSAIAIQQKEAPKMSTINLCDRCGAIAKGAALGTLVYRLAPSTNSYDSANDAKTADVCPACVQDFVEWMDKAPTRENKPFLKPFSMTEWLAAKEAENAAKAISAGEPATTE